MFNQFKSGSVEGTSSSLNISIGFQPRYVKLLNVDGTATLEWEENMGARYGLKALTSGIMSLITTLGISKYAGTTPPQALTGTCAVAVGSAVVTGTSTLFTSEVAEGDMIDIGGVQRFVLAIASNTSLTVTEDYTAVQSGVKGYNNSGSGEGFTIGADTDINVSAQTLHYIAFR